MEMITADDDGGTMVYIQSTEWSQYYIGKRKEVMPTRFRTIHESVVTWWKQEKSSGKTEVSLVETDERSDDGVKEDRSGYWQMVHHRMQSKRAFLKIFPQFLKCDKTCFADISKIQEQMWVLDLRTIFVQATIKKLDCYDFGWEFTLCDANKEKELVTFYPHYIPVLNTDNLFYGLEKMKKLSFTLPGVVNQLLHLFPSLLPLKEHFSTLPLCMVIQEIMKESRDNFFLCAVDIYVPKSGVTEVILTNLWDMDDVVQ
eukprot:TRINITY_DN5737_c0_g1_i4.p1 TRINITY_DN5737_c0_g1~~TRINITY_DN5737_c0_g1_i4.p1  ORF type:complete len:257 (-),score=61.39 TRINITY_DN5737_c0_g1_i4:245-1015(-)